MPKFSQDTSRSLREAFSSESLMRDQDLAILTKAKELGVLPSESTLEDLQASRRGVFHELVKRGVETIPFPGGEIKLKGTFSPRQ